MKVTSGDVAKLENNFIYVNHVTEFDIPHRHRLFVKKIQRVETTTDVYECFIDRQFYGNPHPGDELIDQHGVNGYIEPTTAKITIVNAGKNFKIGQVFNINSGTASGMQAKVVRIHPETGGLKELQIINFGMGYQKDFDFRISRFDAVRSSQLVSYDESGASITQVDPLSKGYDYGYIARTDFHSGDYVVGGYSGDILGDFYYSNVPASVEQELATLHITLGALSRYPGYYKSSNSLIDEDSYIHDGEYYQDFSYLIKIDEKLDSYRDAVFSALHPVGRKLFSDYLIENQYSLTYQVSNPVIRLLIPQYSVSNETAVMADSIISSVKTTVLPADGTTRFFTFNTEPINFVFMSVRVNRVTVNRTTAYRIDGNQIEFYIPPEAGSYVEATFATINYPGLESYPDAIVDFNKGVTDGTNPVTEVIPFKNITKDFKPQYGNHDYVEVPDLQTEIFYKPLPSLETLEDEELDEDAKERLTIADSSFADFYKPVNETLLTSEVQTYTFAKSINKSEDILSSTDVFDKVLNKYLTDSVSISDYIPPPDFRKGLTETVTIEENFQFNRDGTFVDGVIPPTDIYYVTTGKALTDSTTGFTESGVIQLSPYSIVEAGSVRQSYFAEDYQSGKSTF